jgi:hypothetical protein
MGALVLALPLVMLQVRFVVMANIFVTDLLIHRRYDIKGSTEGRTAGAAAKVRMVVSMQMHSIHL